MKTIQLPDEFLSDITKEDLKENYELLKTDLEECIRIKKSMNYYSDRYIEEKKHLTKIVNAFETVLDFYGVKV